MVNKHVRRCSTSLGAREMQIKTVMKYHYIHSNITKMERKKLRTNVDQELIHCWCDYKMIHFGERSVSSL